MLERLDDRQVGVGKLDVLADQADAHRLGGRLDPRHDLLPRREVEGVLADVDAQHLAHHVVEAFVVEDQRQLVDVAGVGGVDDGAGVDVAQVGDLAP